MLAIMMIGVVFLAAAADVISQILNTLFLADVFEERV